jgi:hypothetical protein
VAEFVGQHGDAEFSSGLLHRLLHVGFVHPVAIFKVGARME